MLSGEAKRARKAACSPGSGQSALQESREGFALHLKEQSAGRWMSSNRALHSAGPLGILLKVQFNQLTETWLYFRINEHPSNTDISYCGLGRTSREIQLDH